MSSAITVQWIGIAAASAVVVVLLAILVLRRSHASRSRQITASPPPPRTLAVPSSSFLDEPVKNGFDSLGKLDKKSATPAPTVPAGPAVETAAPAGPAEPLETNGRLAWGDSSLGTVHDILPQTAAVEPTAHKEVPVPPRSGPQTARATPLQEATAASMPAGAAVAPSGTDESVPEAGTTDAGAVVRSALGDVIVTTNQAQVDLSDPEVRRLIKSLIRDEIELAELYRKQGQNLDAILQLTEAEKACVALGMTSQAKLIKAMMKELQP